MGCTLRYTSNSAGNGCPANEGLDWEMRLLQMLLNPAIIGLLALVLSVIWMVRDERDKTRPMLVLALTLNLFYGFLLTVFMSREGSLFPMKYDPVLYRLDTALGVSAAAVAIPLQGAWRLPLVVVYNSMIPMMICWFLVTRYRNIRGAVVLAYVAELISGPMMYAILPACGPIYAFGAQWLHPPTVTATTFRLVGMPNAFPSLHFGTALVLVFFAPGKLWRAVALAFLAGTGLATLSTGEHYIIDLVSGAAFGCFAASFGLRRVKSAILFLGVMLAWSLAVRFQSGFLILHPTLTLLFVALTLALAILAVIREWSSPVESASSVQAGPGA
jgi:hypothetical protein